MRKARYAIVTPANAEMGALTQTLFVACKRVRISPQAPNAVTKHDRTVGLKKDIPGIPVWS
jgi:hypothetical protein